jgi:hypothetical protein
LPIPSDSFSFLLRHRAAIRVEFRSNPLQEKRETGAVALSASRVDLRLIGGAEVVPVLSGTPNFM